MPLTVVIGESDTGKTTFVTAVVNAAIARGLTVAIVDADLGQSEVGPPTTIGLGRAAAPLARLSDAQAIALHFVGVTSPARNVLGAVVGTGRLVARARAARFDRVVVDTSGLVAAGLGRALKQAKIELVEPDVVVCLQRRDECEPIVHAYAAAARPAIVRLRAAAGVRPRGVEERRRYREERLRAHLASARQVALEIARVVMRLPGGEVATAAALGDVRGVIAGLESAARDTLGLGVLRQVDIAAGVLLVDTVVSPDDVATVRIGRETFEE